MAVNMYADDKDGKLPSLRTDRWWVAGDYSVTDRKLKGQDISRNPKLAYNGYLTTAEVWFCPSAIFKKNKYPMERNKRQLEAYNQKRRDNLNITLGYVSHPQGSPLPERISNKSPNDIPPSHLIWSGCTYSIGDPSTTWLAGLSTHTSGNWTTPVNGVNVVLLSGAVEWLHNSSPHRFCFYNNQYSARNIYPRTMWNYVYMKGAFIHRSNY